MPLRNTLLLTAGFIAVCPLAACAEGDGLTFERDVRPILKQHCFHCHGEDPEKHAGLDLRLVRLMVKGGDSGPALSPGSLETSLLWEKVSTDEMPEGAKKMPPAQKEILKAWIEQGARTARAEPEDPSQLKFTPEELDHWSFRPVQKPAVPRLEGSDSGNPIDAFLLEKLQAQGIAGLSPEADRRTLIRRATFDLLGRPPTPDEVSVFLADAAEGAFERLIDRLLASPQYGERWARHWLDIAGYSETDGVPGTDVERPHAWRYRDYVIASLNSDKPYSEFVIEQLAGDELASRPWNLTDPRTVELLAATGFLRMAPDVTQSANSLMDRNQAVADVLKVTGSAMLGLTVGCAQCHDHKYDPIAADDYYRLRAVFDPAFNLQNWQQPSQRLVDVTPPSLVEQANTIEAQAAELDKQLQAEMTADARVVQDREVARLPEADREPARTAAETKEADRTQEQKDLLLKYPNVKPIEFVRGFFVEYDKELHAKHTKKQGEITALRDTRPARQYVMLVSETPGARPESRVHFRGDPEQPKQAVQPGELTALDPQSQCAISDAPPESPTSGRRLAYARWLTRGDHPLTGRVIVNRLWLHHFGRGLVSTPGDFGHNGDRPSHPQLLDWLACDLVDHGWGLKRMHRLMMTSAAYRQVSAHREDLDRLDPDNRLLGRMNLHRLEAEAVRDALIAVGGRITEEVGGPSVPITEDGEGKPVFGRRKTAEGLFAGVAGIGTDEFRRSIYIQSKRALPLIMLETFDLPAMTPNCDQRRSSTVATQSLMFLNDETVWTLAQAMAERLQAERSTPEARISLAYELLYCCEPTPDELQSCTSFVTASSTTFQESADAAFQEKLKQQPEAANVRALAALCQTLMCSNRFLYVD